jgi:O-antigen/teichoic acid export membrane protein
MNPRRMKERLARSVFWVVWSRAAIHAVSLASTLLVARLLQPADYGLMALASVWIGIVALLAELGLGAAIIQFRDLDDRDLNACFWLILGLALLGYVALFVSAPTLAAWFNSERLAVVLRVVGLSLPLAAARVVPDALLRKRLELDRLSWAELVSASATIPVVLFLAFRGAGVWALVVAHLVMQLVQLVMCFWLVRWRPGLRVVGQRLGPIVRFSLATLGSRACWSLYTQADRLVLGKLAGESVLGIYSMAKQLATMPAERLSVIANQLAGPTMAEMQDNIPAIRAAFRRVLRLIICFSWPLSIGLMLTARDAIRLVLTDKWLPAVPALQVLCFYTVFLCIGTLFPAVLSARYRADVVFRYTLSQLLIMPVAFAVGAWWLEGLGVAIAWATVYPLTLVWIASRTLREIGWTWRPFLAELWPPAAGTLVMVIVVLGAHALMGRIGIVHPGERLLVSITTGGLGYLSAMYLVGGATIFREILEVVSWLIPNTAARNRLDAPEVTPSGS